MPRPAVSAPVCALALLCVCLPLVTPSLSAAEPSQSPASAPVYFDATLPLDTRARDLVSRLTLEEKASLMANGSPGVARLGIPKYDWWNEALHGVARAGHATVFPQAIGLAATWDDTFMHSVASTVGLEARAKFNEAIRLDKRERYFGLTFWTPNINIFRDPRWGRGQETYGEDPFLTARLGVAFVRGLQGDDPRHLQSAACAKHFAVHSGPEGLRHGFDAAPDETDFHDTYLPAFEALVREAKVEAVMTAYNALYGQPCAINPRLYGLLSHWGFDGHVVSDCGSIYDLHHSYKTARDDAEAEAVSVRAGLNLRCGDEAPALADAVRRGLITETEVDLRLAQLLKTMFRLGFFDPPGSVSYSKVPFSENNSPAHAALALDAARKSIVLLKNDGLLPLRPEKLRRVAVIGPNADSLSALLGNYNGTPSAPVTVLAGLKAALGPSVLVDHAAGCDYAGMPDGQRPIPRTGLRFGEYTGLQGHYFANPDLAGEPAALRRDRPVDFDWSKPDTKRPPNVPAENFSVRWTGNLLSTAAGDYQLAVTANGGFRLFLGDELVIDAWSPGEKSRTLNRTLASNGTIPIRLEYFHAGGPPRISLQWTTPAADAGFAAALAAANTADTIIFVGGLTAQLEGEEMTVDYDGFSGGDRTRIELPAVQQRLLEALHATGKPIVFVLMSGGAVAIPWADAHLSAIVQAWYPGQAGGTAVADVLFGRTNPSGRLPVTFYRSTTDLPPFADYGMTGRTYRYFNGPVLYPFGHGLSYTRFRYGPIHAGTASGQPDERVQLTFTVTNTGERDGDEVVQLYAREPASTHPRAQKTLCAFRRITLAKGETKNIEFSISTTALRRWSIDKNDYAIPAGEWHFDAGASSADLRQSIATTIAP